MKKTIPAWILLLAACGCVETVSPEQFLFTYRRGAPPTRTELGWSARYTGHDQEFHYLDVRYSTTDRGAMPLLLYGPYQEKTLSCPVKLLPPEFPDDFRVLYQEGGSESEEETYQYIRYYLKRVGNPHAAKPMDLEDPPPR